MSYGGYKPVDPKILLEVGQPLYQAWLRWNKIDDPHAKLVINQQLGLVGLVGEQRAKGSGKHYDTLPGRLIVEINRIASGVPPLDEFLIDLLNLKKD